MEYIWPGGNLGYFFLRQIRDNYVEEKICDTFFLEKICDNYFPDKICDIYFVDNICLTFSLQKNRDEVF